MAGYIGNKSSVTLVDGYSEAEADAEFVTKTGDSMTGDLSLGDGDKAIFGAGSDLQIYHDGSNSVIKDNGTGNIRIQSTGIVQIGDEAFNETFAQFNDDGAVQLYHNNAVKFETTSTGIDVTGTVSAPLVVVSTSIAKMAEFNSTHANNGYIVLKEDSVDKFYLGASTSVSGQSGSYTFYTTSGLGLDFNTGGAASPRMRIDSSGAVTMPYQPAFFATPNTNQNNIANNNSSVHVLLQTEVFDQNADFASSTFTAPVTGKYMLSYSLCLLNVDSAADYYIPQIRTSNRDINSLYDPGQLNGDPAYWTFTMSVLADMDANDTSTVRIIQNGGTAQTDVEASSLRTYFSGYLVA